MNNLGEWHKRAGAALSRIESLFLGAGACCIVAMGFLITLNVILREVGIRPVPDEVVLVGELMIGALILPLAFVAAGHGFIAVEVLTGRLNRKLRTWLNALSAVVGLVAVIPITYVALLTLEESFGGTYFFGIMELPQWPGRLMFFCGYALFTLRLLDLLIREVLTGLGRIDKSPRRGP